MTRYHKGMLVAIDWPAQPAPDGEVARITSVTGLDVQLELDRRHHNEPPRTLSIPLDEAELVLRKTIHEGRGRHE